MSRVTRNAESAPCPSCPVLASTVKSEAMLPLLTQILSPSSVQ